jgi:hypothetical protein
LNVFKDFTLSTGWSYVTGTDLWKTPSTFVKER